MWKQSILAALTVLGGLAGSAGAASVQVQYAGTIYSIDDASGVLAGSGVGLGSSFSGSFVYDLGAALDADPSPGVGLYDGVNQQWMLQLDALLVFTQQAGAPYNYVDVADDFTGYGLPAYDGFYAYVGQPASMVGMPFDQVEVGLTLQSLDLGALASDGLPLTLDFSQFVGQCSPQIAQQQCAEMELHATSVGGSAVHVFGVLDGLRVNPVVPEPGTAALVCPGLVALSMRTLRARKARRSD